VLILLGYPLLQRSPSFFHNIAPTLVSALTEKLHKSRHGKHGKHGKHRHHGKHGKHAKHGKHRHHHGHKHGKHRHHHGHKHVKHAHKKLCAKAWSPKAGGFNDVWDTSKAFKYSNGLEFVARGNDIYLAVFDEKSPTWSHLIIMSGWGNTETHVYKNGNINNAICVNKMTIKDVTAANDFKVVYDTKAKKN